MIIWTDQDYPTGNKQFKEGDEDSDRRNDGKTTSKSGLALGRQHQRVDWPWEDNIKEWTGLGKTTSKSGLASGRQHQRVDWPWEDNIKEWTGLGKTTSKSGLALGRQHQRVDWPREDNIKEWTGLGKTTSKSGLALGRQHQRVDWPWMEYTTTESREPRGVEAAGCKIYSAAPMARTIQVR